MKVTIITFTCFLFFLQGCYAARIDGPYQGRIIDAETNQPVEGAVVLGVWNTVTITPGGGTHDFYDARETLTDKDGEFLITGMGLKVLSNLEPMDVVIFKVGYEHVGYRSWESLKKDIFFRDKIKWEGNKAVIPLKKWTLEDRRNRFGDYSVNMPDEKRRLLLREIEKENREIGK